MAMQKTILVIEDEPNIARGHQILFREHHVIVASDGEQALVLARAHRPDVVLLDLNLPERNGYDVCFHLRQEPTLRHTKIVMVTAKNLSMDRKRGEFVGADAYVTKPFDPMALKRKVMELLGG